MPSWVYAQGRLMAMSDNPKDQPAKDNRRTARVIGSSHKRLPDFTLHLVIAVFISTSRERPRRRSFCSPVCHPVAYAAIPNSWPVLSPLWCQAKITFSSRSDIVLGKIHKSLTILLQLPQFTVTVLHYSAINRVASPGICLSYVLQWEHHRLRAVEPHILRHDLPLHDVDTEAEA
ncbi:hypothetical protein ARMGADRAFT_436590 [Armillaria gallica]|uniref:Uncharacterized protein n=1 Tax=Armillaria gallica TaxID=47427 RepID=A0A2H3CZ53_ARMGA|nr:hypothetical protein ARMGADRAFT_436590 [Armillaria gallica]